MRYFSRDLIAAYSEFCVRVLTFRERSSLYYYYYYYYHYYYYHYYHHRTHLNEG